MIENFDATVGGQVQQFCASLGEGPRPHRVIISSADTAKTLVIFDVSGLLGALKAEIEEPEKLIADAISKAQEDGLLEVALRTGEIQEAAL
ncbi:hypothetical protein [Paraburkholderia phosphatilytica]|uniref:hypothetical protein n=1 Tax=Paraburkholderia phosphatilytica TaxID=2282883 RepID=UPI000E4CF843|nr:hypothetical protein [Paraburkholderia phosphatilytica]